MTNLLRKIEFAHYSRFRRKAASGFGTTSARRRRCDIFGAMAFYLGIDGGGTKTKFVLGDEHQVLAEATTGGSSIPRSGEAAVRTELNAGVEEVCRRAGIEPAAIRKVVGGITGSSDQEMRDSLRAMLAAQVTCDVEIVGDMVIAHHAALEGAPGILVNSGTGSIAYGRNAKNEIARAGGWGFAISDEGSGYWIGRVALASAMRRYDADKEDGYLHHLMTALGVAEPEDLAKLPAAMSLSQVFPAVVSIAKLGDEAARLILKHAGEELAFLAETLLHRLFADELEVPIAAVGGVFSASEGVFECFAENLRSHHPGVKVWLSNSDAALGALMLARAQP